MKSAKQIVDQFWTSFESGNLAALAELMHPDCHFRMPGVELHDRNAVLGMMAGYHAAFPDMRHRTSHSVESGDTVAIELVVEGTHSGPMQTPQGTIPATGRKVTWQSCDYIRLRDGKVFSWHVYHDPTAFFAALGLAPGAGQ
jgi:ketosteroid isomerase-like protein